jgi:hypothetical protein
MNKKDAARAIELYDLIKKLESRIAIARDAKEKGCNHLSVYVDDTLQIGRIKGSGASKECFDVIMDNLVALSEAEISDVSRELIAMGFDPDCREV